MESLKPSTREQDWRTWEQVCAADACPKDVARSLENFGRHRFMHYLQRYASRSGHRARIGDAFTRQDEAHAWHLFETHAQVGRDRAGKSYKKWLFARAADDSARWTAVVESGASLLMRDAVRAYLRREHSAHFMESLQRPRGTDESGFSLEELLPDDQSVAQLIEERELSDLATQMAHQLLPELDRTERIALWSRSAGLILSDPRVLAWAECGKSKLHRSYERAVERICKHIKKTYAAEGAAFGLALARRTIARLADEKMLEIAAEIQGLGFSISKREPNGEEQK